MLFVSCAFVSRVSKLLRRFSLKGVFIVLFKQFKEFDIVGEPGVVLFSIDFVRVSFFVILFLSLK